MSDDGGLVGGLASAAANDPRYLKGIGTLALIGALVVAVVPGVLASVPALRVVASPLLIGPLGVLAAVLALQAFRAGGETDAREYPTPEYENREPADAPRIGRAVDERIERLLGDEAASGTVRDGVVDDAREHLRDTAVETMVDVEGMDRETATARVRDGTWTDDPRAAAFLGGEAAPALPVWLRIADWLRGAPAVRRIEATVEAIHRHADVEGANAAGSTLDPSEVSSGGSDGTDESDGSDDGTDPSVEELEAFLERAESRAATDGGESQ